MERLLRFIIGELFIQGGLTLKGIGNFTAVLKVIWKNQRSYFIISFGRAILLSAVPMIFVIFPQYIIDAVIHRKLVDSLTWVIAMSVSFLVISILLSMITGIKENSTVKMKAKLTSLLSQKIMSIPYHYLEHPDILNKIERAKAAISGDLGYVVNHGLSAEKGIDGVVTELANIVSLMIRLTTLLYLLSIIDPFVSIILIIVVILNSCLNARKKRADYRMRLKVSPIMRKTQYSRETMHSFEYGKEIRLFHIQNFLVSKFKKNRNEYFNARKDMMKSYNSSDVLTFLFNGAQSFFVYFTVIRSAILGIITIGEFTMLISAVSNFSATLTDIIHAVLNINLYSTYLKDYNAIMGMESELQIENLPLHHKLYDLEFNDVWFRYENAEEYTLKGVSFRIKQGEKLSIVGKNGAGKTTVIKLLARLYQPTKGEILLNGVNILNYNHDSYMNYLSILFQDFETFAFSIKENISFSLNTNDEKINVALKKSGLLEKINTLVEKDNTPLFRFLHQDGIDLSGGEKQKLALARVFYKDAKLIILDEPTASLDPLAEYDIYTRFNHLVLNKTVIYISHRMSSARFCDEILVLDQGSVKEFGSHDVLMDHKGLYYEMFETQAQYYENTEDC